MNKEPKSSLFFIKENKSIDKNKKICYTLIIKRKEIKTMTREEMLTRMIRLYGFEHEAVIQFGWLMARPQISDETLETIVKCHEEHPLWENEDEDE